MATSETSNRKRMLKQTILFLLPSLILLIVFFIGPVILTFFFSFTDFSLTGTTAREVSFVGLNNFKNLFADPRFFSAFSSTMIFLLASGIIGQQLLGFVVAYLMQKKNPLFRKIVGATIMAGWVTPELIVAISFVTFLHDGGTLNEFITQLGFEPVSWLFEYPHDFDCYCKYLARFGLIYVDVSISARCHTRFIIRSSRD